MKESWSWPEIREYWETHQSQRGHADLADDPDGLSNVCFSGAPVWLNEFFASEQRLVFLRLLGEASITRQGRRALDVGCGAGRWSRLLAQSGFSVLGIDLQGELLELAREASPGVEFAQTAVQEVDESEAYDLVTSVTVLQHLPESEQVRAMESISRAIRPSGNLLLLENLRDRGVHVFSRSEEEWVELAQAAGLILVGRYRYDYNLALRGIDRGRVVAQRLLRRGRRATEPSAAEAFGRARWSVRTAQRMAVSIDSRLGPELRRRQPPALAGHCALLFRKANRAGAQPDHLETVTN